jgi:outer membrane lipoprotein SlyB
MKKILISLIFIAILSGCAAQPRGVDVSKKTEIIVHQNVKGGIEIPPVDSNEKMVSFDIKSQAQYDVKASLLTEKLKAALAVRGWKVVEPSKAKLSIAITVEGLEQTVYNQKVPSGATGGVVGAVLGGIASSGNVNGVLLGGIAGAIAEKTMSSSAQDIYWQMNTRVTFRSKDGLEIDKVATINTNTPSEFGDQRDQRRATRMLRDEEYRLETLRLQEEKRLRRQGKQEVAVKEKAKNEWSNPVVVQFSQSANKADLTLDEALPSLQNSLVNSLSGVL